jgi:hypothetical protein
MANEDFGANGARKAKEKMHLRNLDLSIVTKS